MPEIPIAHVDPVLDAGMDDKLVLGYIALSTDVVTEYELRAMLSDPAVSISSTRIITHNPMTIDHLRGHADEIAKAAALYDPPESIRVFMYGCTSGSAIISQELLETKLRSIIPEGKLTSPMTGALRAFEMLGIRRIAMLTPYPDDITRSMIDCVTTAGVSVVSAASFHMENDLDVVRIAPKRLVEAAELADHPDADALFIPCTGIRGSTIIDPLEQRLAKPVITAHQAMLWDALRLAGYRKLVPGFGRFLSLKKEGTPQ